MALDCICHFGRLLGLRLYRVVHDGRCIGPFMRRNPIWPSTFPKVLSILGIIASSIILLGLEKGEPKIGDIGYRRSHEYKLCQALLLFGLMVAYALRGSYLGPTSS